MTQDYASSIQGAALRVSRLQSDGSLATGASASYVLTTAFMTVSFTPEFEDGEDITEKGANGAICVSFKTNDTLKRVSLELAICNPDPAFTEMLGGGTILGNALGYQAPLQGVDANTTGNSLEVWSKAIVDGRPASVNPYWHWLFPYVQLRPTGARVVENGLLANTFSGWGVGNVQFDAGTPQHATNVWAYTSGSAYQYAREATAPSTVGYNTVT